MRTGGRSCGRPYRVAVSRAKSLRAGRHGDPQLARTGRGARGHRRPRRGPPGASSSLQPSASSDPKLVLASICAVSGARSRRLSKRRLPSSAGRPKSRRFVSSCRGPEPAKSSRARPGALFWSSRKRSSAAGQRHQVVELRPLGAGQRQAQPVLQVPGQHLALFARGHQQQVAAAAPGGRRPGRSAPAAFPENRRREKARPGSGRRIVRADSPVGAAPPGAVRRAPRAGRRRNGDGHR